MTLPDEATRLSKGDVARTKREAGRLDREALWRRAARTRSLVRRHCARATRTGVTLAGGSTADDGPRWCCNDRNAGRGRQAGKRNGVRLR